MTERRIRDQGLDCTPLALGGRFASSHAGLEYEPTKEDYQGVDPDCNAVYLAILVELSLVESAEGTDGVGMAAVHEYLAFHGAHPDTAPKILEWMIKTTSGAADRRPSFHEYLDSVFRRIETLDPGAVPELVACGMTAEEVAGFGAMLRKVRDPNWRE